MKTAYKAVLAALWMAVAAAPALAHHEIAGYDTDHPLVLNGVVRQFVWANPHVMLYVEVGQAEDTRDVWTLEAGAVQALTRHGWNRDSLHRGDRIEVMLAPKLHATYSGRILQVRRSDGRVLSVGMPSGAP
ncbi:MAG TPA: DUF6152 family protein [Steroidobacteraceae bacterium]|nr:DUF6152 family protein [Steroidobacteraceae bacterium]